MDNFNRKLWQDLARAIAGQETSLAEYTDETVALHVAKNGVAALLHQAEQQGTVSGISTKVAELLAGAARSQAALDLLLNNSTRQFTDLLESNGIPALLLKGTPVAQLYYPKSWLRERCDTDVYIRECDVKKAIALLQENNYQIGGHLDREYASKQFGASINTFQHINTHFDVHWKLSNRILFQTTLPFEECEANKQAVPALGPNAWTLAKQDLLLHACIHRIAHGRNTERNRLLWLYDIELLWQSMDEEEKEAFTNKALEKKIGTLCADALQTCATIFTKNRESGVSREEQSSKLQKNKKTEPTAPLINASKPRWALADLLALKGLSPKWGFIKELLHLQGRP